jgi:hypothetical protein
MPVQSIHRLNPFALQHGSNLQIHEKIQQIIFYAESRFWTILTNISNADQEHQAWTQNLLQQELVCLAFGLSDLADILQSFLSYLT